MLLKKLLKNLLFALDKEKLIQFKNRHQKGRCVIIGNGPSVNLQDLEKLSEATTICCNRFHLAYSHTNFRPDYTVVIDKKMIEDFGDDIFSKAKTQTFSGRTFFPKRRDNIFYLPLVGGKFKFSKDITKFVSTGDSVIVVAIQIALYMGMKEIYLYGIDHHFIHSDKDKNTGMVNGDGNHFIANYRNGKDWFPPNIEKINSSLIVCSDFLTTQRGFLKNTTRGGKLDVLERESIKVLINEKI